jgi:NADH:ubiquinone oxidoreductase subunit 6 (subunit J)
MYSIAFVVMVSLGSSALMLLMGVDFFAIFLLIIFSGMMGVLAFFVQSLNLNTQTKRSLSLRESCLIGLGLTIVLAEILTVLYLLARENKAFTAELQNKLSLEALKVLLHDLAFLLFDTYSYTLEICGVILFVGIVSSFVLIYSNDKQSQRRRKEGAPTPASSQRKLGSSTYPSESWDDAGVVKCSSSNTMGRG